MPCDLGYRSYMEVKIPAPQPLKFKKKIEAPKIDAELLRNIGEENSEFVEFLQDLDIGPLLEKALKLARQNIKNSNKIKFFIQNGSLQAEASYKSDSEKEAIERITAEVAARFQMEVLAIVLEILEYETSVTKEKNKGGQAGAIVLEGEKHE